jgi:hypothetical protein
MAKKNNTAVEDNNQDAPKESKLDRIFKPFLPNHHVSFSQLKDILSALTGDDDEDETQDETAG